MTALSRRTFLKFSALTFASAAAAALPGPAVQAAPATEAQGLFSVSPASQRIALTFDDGYVNVAWLLDVCKELDVRLTLFPIGKVIAAKPQLWKRALEDGHEIGCHTYSHPALAGQPYEFAAQELDAFLAVARQHLGLENVRYFRPPYGSGWNQEAVQRAAHERGLLVIMWNRTNGSRKLAARPTWRDVVADFKKTARAGDIFLYHFHYQEVAAMKSIVEYCRAQGWQPGTVSELLTA